MDLLLWIISNLFIISTAYSYSQQCTYESSGTIRLQSNQNIALIPIRDELEISFTLKIDTPVACNGFCHIFAIGDNYDRHPLIYTQKSHGYSGRLYCQISPYDEIDVGTTAYNLITDGFWHSLYFSFTDSRMLITIDSYTFIDYVGTFDFRSYAGNSYYFSAVWYNVFQNQFHHFGDLTNVCIISRWKNEPTASPTPSPTPSPTLWPTSDPTSSTYRPTITNIPTISNFNIQSIDPPAVNTTSSSPVSSSTVPTKAPTFGRLNIVKPTSSINYEIYASLDQIKLNNKSMRPTHHPLSVIATSAILEAVDDAELNRRGMSSSILATLVACAVTICCITLLYIGMLRYIANRKKEEESKERVDDEEQSDGDGSNESTNNAKYKMHTHERLESASIQSVDEYADVDDMTVISGILKIKITQSRLDNEMPEEKVTILENKSSQWSQTTFNRKNSNDTVITSSTNLSAFPNGGSDMSAIETYDSHIHGDGLKRMLTPVSEISMSSDQHRGGGLRSRKCTDLSEISDVSGASQLTIDDIRIMEINCIVYSFDVLLENGNSIESDWDVEPFETKINRLVQHMQTMKQNNLHLVIVSNSLSSKRLTAKLRILQLSKLFGNECVIGWDHVIVDGCNASIEYMIKRLVDHLNIERNEMLFVGNNRTNAASMKMNGVCQIYNVRGKGVLKGKDLIFLETRALDGIQM